MDFVCEDLAAGHSRAEDRIVRIFFLLLLFFSFVRLILLEMLLKRSFRLRFDSLFHGVDTYGVRYGVVKFKSLVKEFFFFRFVLIMTKRVLEN